MPKPNDIKTFVKKQPRWRIAGVILILALGFYFLKDRGQSTNNAATFTARRGPLEINVLEGGSIQALESQEVKCEVRVGYQGTKILRIVEEGYQVTEDDVRTNKVLVELDSSELQKQITQQEIQYQSSLAALTDAQQAYEIQLNQNLSDVKAAEQKSRFARMDFDKFLGDTVTQEIVDQFGLEKELMAEKTNVLETAAATTPPTLSVGPSSGLTVAAAQSSDAPRVIAFAGGVEQSAAAPIRADAPPPSSALAVRSDAPPADAGLQSEPVEEPPSIVIDFSKYATIESLGDGEAKQKLRKFEDDLQVARKELGQATATLEGTRRLFEKGFVTKNDLERDEIAHGNSLLKVQTAETARDLFLKYEFPKSAEESLSKYVEAMRELVRARKAAVAKLAQADAKLKSSQGQYAIQTRQRKDLQEQLEKCTIQAKKTGLVVYGGGRDDMYYYGGQEPIREGATVRERQAIITIPDMTRMAVNVKIHESYIKKVKKGQKVRITVDAFPDSVLEGAVTKVGVLPDSQNRWMNPDLKVYLTQITIEGTHDWIKPGMSAKAEILVNQLPDVVYVPIQAVSPADGKQVCYVVNGSRSEQREVEIGEFNDEFIEIKSGLKEGEKVLLRPPEATGPESGDQDRKPNDEEGDKDKAKPDASPMPATAAPAGSA